MDEKLATAEALIIEGKDTMKARCSMVRHVSHEVRLPYYKSLTDSSSFFRRYLQSHVPALA